MSQLVDDTAKQHEFVLVGDQRFIVPVRQLQSGILSSVPLSQFLAELRKVMGFTDHDCLRV